MVVLSAKRGGVPLRAMGVEEVGKIQWARVHGVVTCWQMGKRLLAISKGRLQTMDSRKRGMAGMKSNVGKKQG